MPALDTSLGRIAARAARHKRYQAKKQKTNYQPNKTTPTATVSEYTRQQLLNEALHSPAFEGMKSEEIKAFIEERLNTYLTKLPWWFGHLVMDRPKPQATAAQLQALQKARQVRIQHAKEEEQRHERLRERIRQDEATAEPPTTTT